MERAKTMNLEERLVQVRKDKSLLDAEEKEILSKIEEQKQSKKVPIISLFRYYKNDRAVINFTDDMIKFVKDGAKQITVWSNGIVGDWRRDYKLTPYYTKQKLIFGQINT